MDKMKPILVGAVVGGVAAAALSKVGMPGLKGLSLGSAFMAGAAIGAVSQAVPTFFPKIVGK